MANLTNPVVQLASVAIKRSNKDLIRNSGQMATGEKGSEDLVGFVVGSSLRSGKYVLGKVSSSGMYGRALLGIANANLEAVRNLLIDLRKIIAAADTAGPTTLSELDILYKEGINKIIRSIQTVYKFDGRTLFDGSIADGTGLPPSTQMPIGGAPLGLRIGEDINNSILVSIPKLLAGDGSAADVIVPGKFTPLFPITNEAADAIAGIKVVNATVSAGAPGGTQGNMIGAANGPGLIGSGIPIKVNIGNAVIAEANKVAGEMVAVRPSFAGIVRNVMLDTDDYLGLISALNRVVVDTPAKQSLKNFLILRAQVLGGLGFLGGNFIAAAGVWIGDIDSISADIVKGYCILAAVDVTNPSNDVRSALKSIIDVGYGSQRPPVIVGIRALALPGNIIGNRIIQAVKNQLEIRLLNPALNNGFPNGDAQYIIADALNPGIVIALEDIAAFYSTYDVLTEANRIGADTVVSNAFVTANSLLGFLTAQSEELLRSLNNLDDLISVYGAGADSYLLTEYEVASKDFQTALLALQGSISAIAQAAKVSKATLDLIESNG